MIWWSLVAAAGLVIHEPAVVFFGGYRSTPQQVECWSEGLKAAQRTKSMGVSYPPGTTSGQHTPDRQRPEYQKAYQMALRAKPAIIVGHSSGAQYNEYLIHDLLKAGKSPDEIVSINLDGFQLPKDLRNKVRSVCWAGQNGALKSQLFGSGCKVHTAQRCSTKSCLHFSLVNNAVPSDLGGESDYSRRGYARVACETPDFWYRDLGLGSIPAARAREAIR